MKKFLRIAGISLLVILVILIALPFFLKDKIAEEIRSAINEQVNAEVYFGDVSLSLFKDFPRLSLQIDSLRITNKEPFAGVELVNLKSLKTSLNLWSVFGDEIKVLELGLENPKIDIRVLEDGSANYDIAKASEEAETPEAETTEEASAFKMNLKNFYINDGMVHYEDASLPMLMDIKDLDHQGSGDFGTDQFALVTKTTMESLDFEFDGVKYIRKAKTSLDATMDMNLAEMAFTFKDNLLKLNELELAAEGWIKMPEDDIDMDISFSAPSSDFKQLLSMVPAEFASDLSGVDVSGSMAFAGFVRGTYNENSLPGFGINVDVENGRFKYPDLPSSAENIQIKLAVDASDGNDYDKMKIDIPVFHVELAENPFDMTLALRTPMSDPDIDMTLQSQLDFEKMKGVIPMEEEMKGRVTADFALKGKMSAIEQERYEDFDASGQIILQEFLYKSDSLAYDMDINVAYFTFTPAFLDLSQFRARVGRSDIQATGRIENYLAYYLRDTTLNGRFTLNSNVLDLNEFMSEDETAETTETAAEDTSSMSVIRVPSNIDFKLDASIQSMLYDNLDIRNISGDVRLKQGVASLNGLTMSLMEGTVVMNGSYDSRPDEPMVNFNYEVRNFDIKKTAAFFETVEKMAPIAKHCSGKFSTNMDFSTRLNSKMEPIEESIDGKGSLQTASVYVSGFEPLMKVADALGIDKLSKQTIQDVKLTYVIRDGKAVVDPFTIKLEGIPTTMYGHTTFDSEIDYHADMEVPFDKLPKSVGNQANSLVSQINSKLGTNLSAGTTIPVHLHITGTVTSPKVATNMKDGAKGAANDAIQDLKEQAKEEVKELIDNSKEEALAKARQEADKILADAQKQADDLMAQARTQSERVRSEGYAKAKELEDKAKGPIEKAAAKVAAEKLRKEADNSANKIVAEAQKQSDQIMASARQRADDKLKSVE